MTAKRCKTWDCCLLIGALLLGGCGDKPPPSWSGYAEGDYLYIAAPLAGRLDQLHVAAGQLVSLDALLFSLDPQAEHNAQDEAAARLQIARAQVANIAKGRRQDELAVTQAQQKQAQAALALAQNDLSRQQQLAAQGFVSKARLTDAQTALQQAQARLAETSAALLVAQLPARADERAAAAANANAASAALRQAQWLVGQKQQRAPTAATVAEVYFWPGEWVPAGQPVLSLLPPERVKARFFVPQAALASVPPGRAIEISCDGCRNPLPAHVTHVASQAEFTPPVIYSNEQRAKMMFMVEAQPDQPGQLHPGQPLDVRLTAQPSSAP